MTAKLDGVLPDDADGKRHFLPDQLFRSDALELRGDPARELIPADANLIVRRNVLLCSAGM
jgi:hypothetical protein